jgi:hypothetical protein
MQLKLSKHRAEMGVINNRIEKHGDDDVTAFDCPIKLLLDPDKFDELLGAGRHDHWFTKSGRTYDLVNPEIETFSLKYDLDVGSVVIHLDKSDLEFDGARLKGLTLEPLKGGETALRFKLQVRPENKHIIRLIDMQNRDFKLSVDKATIAQKEKSKQQQLALDGKNGGNGPPDGVDGEMQDKRMRERAAALADKCPICKDVETKNGVCPSCLWNAKRGREATDREIARAGVTPLRTDQQPS